MPPLPERDSTNAVASARLDGVAGLGASHMTDVCPAKVTTLKVSVGRMASITRCMTALDFSIGKPLIDPDVSMTKISSRGGTCAASMRSGGWTISVKNPPE